MRGSGDLALSITKIVVLDTETTGTDPAEGAALLEVAWVSLDASQLGWLYGAEGTYADHLIRHDGPIPAEARAVHHISPSMVGPESGALTQDALLHGMLAAEEPGDMVYAAHKAAFDRKFLPDLTLPWICTLRCAMHLYPDAPSHKNQVLRYHLGAEPPAAMLGALAPHRALYDTAVTAAILAIMLETHTPEELLELTTAPVLLDVVKFGKYKGSKWSEVPRDYLSWMMRSGNWRDDPDVMHTVRQYL